MNNIIRKSSDEWREMRYSLMKNDEIVNVTHNIKRGFTKLEVEELTSKNIEYKIIDMAEDLQKINKSVEISEFCEESSIYMQWYNEYVSSSIMNHKNFGFPFCAENNFDYEKKLFDVLDEYQMAIKNGINTKYEPGLINEVSDICEKIKLSLKSSIDGDNKSADMLMESILEHYISNDFFVSRLDDSYAFRGLSRFDGIYEGDNDLIKNEELTFFRGVKSQNCDLYRILNCPFSALENASIGRFSVSNTSCLYIGTTSHVCAIELNFDYNTDDTDERFYVSALKFNDLGKNLKVLNLTTTRYLNIYDRRRDIGNNTRRNYWIGFLKMLPLLIATSYTLHDKDMYCRYEYLLSQSLMRSINKLGIDGVAYLSCQGDSDFQFPHGVNLAIPVPDVSEDNQYGSLKEKFYITNPVLFNRNRIHEKNVRNKSFINKVWPNDKIFNDKLKYKEKMVYYGETIVGKFDNMVVSEEFIDGGKI